MRDFDILTRLVDLDRRLGYLEGIQRLKGVAKTTRILPPLAQGDRIGYAPNKERDVLWTGVVIPRPYNARERGLEGPFIHVMRDGDGVALSYYRRNLLALGTSDYRKRGYRKRGGK